MLYIRFLGTCLITGMSVHMESELHANPSLKTKRQRPAEREHGR
jgi:hypothetical protein